MRFRKPENIRYPKMIELFARTGFELTKINGLTPIHIDDEVSGLSAILLNEEYYQLLLNGRDVIEVLILVAMFGAAWIGFLIENACEWLSNIQSQSFDCF